MKPCSLRNVFIVKITHLKQSYVLYFTYYTRLCCFHMYNTFIYFRFCFYKYSFDAGASKDDSVPYVTNSPTVVGEDPSAILAQTKSAADLFLRRHFNTFNKHGRCGDPSRRPHGASRRPYKLTPPPHYTLARDWSR